MLRALTVGVAVVERGGADDVVGLVAPLAVEALVGVVLLVGDLGLALDAVVGLARTASSHLVPNEYARGDVPGVGTLD